MSSTRRRRDGANARRHPRGPGDVEPLTSAQWSIMRDVLEANGRTLVFRGRRMTAIENLEKRGLVKAAYDPGRGDSPVPPTWTIYVTLPRKGAKSALEVGA